MRNAAENPTARVVSFQQLIGMSAVPTHPEIAPQIPHCVAGHVELELANVEGRLDVPTALAGYRPTAAIAVT
jgi:hypothetical protein